MDKETIIDYVTKTPANTNKAVLGGMLDSFAGGGGGGGGASAFFINVEVSWSDAINNYVIDSIDKTHAEILSAYQGGALLIAKVNDSEENMLFQISLSVVNGNAFLFEFVEPVVENGTITATMAYCLRITSSPENNSFVYGESA